MNDNLNTSLDRRLSLSNLKLHLMRARQRETRAFNARFSIESRLVKNLISFSVVHLIKNLGFVIALSNRRGFWVSVGDVCYSL
jgi:hypothetical protein